MLLTLPQTTLETFKIPQVVYIGDTFPTNPRKPPWSRRTAKDIKYLVIHHSASTGTLEAENRYHVNNNNWYKLSYHISIDRNHIVQINDMLDVTPHALGANANGIGICVNWDLRKRGLTMFEKNALFGTIITLKGLFPGVEVVGHNEISKRLANHATSCPVISMNQLRSDIAAAEELLSYNATTPADRAVCYAIAERVNDLKSKLTHAQWGTEARRKLSLLSAVANGTTAEETADNVLHMYDVALQSKWGQEETRLLVEVAKYAKRMKVM